MLWGWVASSPYVLRTWCQKSPPTFTRYIPYLTRTRPSSLRLCPVLTWRMLQVQNIPIESGYCQSWEWGWLWYLYKYTTLPPTPSFQPCFSPYPSPKSNPVWADSMAVFGFQSKKPGNWSWSHSRSKIIMLWYPNSCEGCKIWRTLFLNFQCSEKKTPCLLSLWAVYSGLWLGSPPSIHRKDDFQPVGISCFNLSVNTSFSSLTLCECQESSLETQEEVENFWKSLAEEIIKLLPAKGWPAPAGLDNVKTMSLVRIGWAALLLLQPWLSCQCY